MTSTSLSAVFITPFPWVQVHLPGGTRLKFSIYNSHSACRVVLLFTVLRAFLSNALPALCEEHATLHGSMPNKLKGK